MKQVKLPGIIASVLAAFAMAVPTTTQAATGDIRSIEPITTLDHPTYGPNDLVRAGEEIKFKIRLLNRHYNEHYNNATNENPWQLKWTGLAPADAALALYEPKIGLMVGGRLREASISLERGTHPAAGTKSYWTDVICTYTAKAGDFAVPVVLSNSTGTDGAVNADQTSLSYYLKNIGDYRWKIVDTHDENECQFYFGSQALTPADYPDYMGNFGTGEVRDFDLHQADMCIQSMDFDENYSEPASPAAAGPSIWREIYAGQTATKKGGLPSIYVPGGTTADTSTFYIWADDPAVAELSMGGEAVYGGRKVYSANLPAGTTNFTFKIRAIATATNQTTTVYLSSTPTNIFNASGDVITNFTTRVVKVVEAPAPYVSLTLNGDETDYGVSPSANYQNPSTYMKVTLSQEFTYPVTVKLNASLQTDNDNTAYHYLQDIYNMNILGMSLTTTGYSEQLTNLVFAAGETEKTIYVYALGYTQKSGTKGISFMPDVSAYPDFASGTHSGCTLKLSKMKPVITNITGPESVIAGLPAEFHVTFDDCFMNLAQAVTPGYSIEVKTEDGEEWTIAAGNAFDSTSYEYNDQEFTLPVVFDSDASPKIVNFRLCTPDGSTFSAWKEVRLDVTESKKVKAQLVDVKPCAEGTTASVQFSLTQKYTYDAYAFLIPKDAETARCISSDVSTNGVSHVMIPKNKTTPNPGVFGTLTFLDGPCNGNFEVVICRKPNFDVKVAAYGSDGFNVTVTNAFPAVKNGSVKMGSTALDGGDGATMSVPAAVNVKKTFTVRADDVDFDLDAVGGDVFKTKWTVYDGSTAEYIVDGNPMNTNMVHQFTTQNEKCKITVEFQDKDMRAANPNLWSDPFTFYVKVRNVPSVTVKTDAGTDNFFESYEGSTVKKKTMFYPGLSIVAEDNLQIGLSIYYLGSDNAWAELSSTNVTVFAGEEYSRTGVWLDPDTINGTKQSASKGFRVNMKVLTTTTNANNTVGWNDYYAEYDWDFMLNNVNPVIVTPDEGLESLTNNASMNVPVTIPWEVSDVGLDISNANFKVVWSTSDGGGATYQNNIATGEYWYEGVFTNIFSTAGTKQIKMTVYDGDNGTAQRTLYYFVSPSKNVYVIPQGPFAGKGQSALSQKYRKCTNVGVGRVWADGQYSGTYSPNGAVMPFMHQYFYGTTAQSTMLFAWGYRAVAGTEDDGLLGGIGDWPLAMDGTHTDLSPAPTGPFYQIPVGDGRDSFFYCWVNSTDDGEGGGSAGSLLGGLAPVIGFDPANNAGQVFSLPTDELGDEQNVYYLNSTVEAIFSKEKYAADNMGDLNNDGIPDHFAIDNVWQGVLYRAASGGGEDEGDSSAASTSTSTSEDTESVGADVDTDLSDYNGDGDYWPYLRDNPFGHYYKGELIYDWLNDVADGSKDADTSRYQFTALDEIRGVHSGLNERGVSDMDMSDAELLATTAMWMREDPGAATWANVNQFFNTGTFTDVDGITREWSVERRTNPMKERTEKNNRLPDGYSYFIWYYARIGEIQGNGALKRLTGLRFSLDTLGQGEEIPSEIVAWAFDPCNAARSLAKTTVTAFDGRKFTIDPYDFDNDGIPDDMEIALGTNPISCDTDGDGIPDGYEILMGLDPLDPRDNVRTAVGNPDGDFMAWRDAGSNTVVRLWNGKAGDASKTVLYAFPDAPSFSVETGTNLYSKITVDAEHVYYVLFMAAGDEPAFVTIAGKKYLADSVFAHRQIMVGTDACLGGLVALPAGTMIDSVEFPDPTDPAYNADDWVVPSAKLDDAEALKVFKYGDGDAAVYVPVPIDGVTKEAVDSNYVVDENLGLQALAYIHHQVFQVAGFDPRTGWYKDSAGYLAARWRVANSDAIGSEGFSGLAVDTVAYSSLDEFLVMRYRTEVESTEKVNFRGKLAPADNTADSLSYFTYGAGYVTCPFEHMSVTNTADGSVRDVFGADTDGDGIPDGWELYVNIDPTWADDATLVSANGDSYNDFDSLNFLQEYAGTDSCNAYSNVVSIYQHHPGNTQGWFNKFFPTNPYSNDTDGDGLSDSQETGAYSGYFYAGSTEYIGTKFFFIYGEPKDNGTCCIRGGGLNPCTVDTDQDLLPDAWEYEFAGVVFADGAPLVLENGAKVISLSPSDLVSLTRADGLANSVEVNLANGIRFEIRGGMDGTWAGDASFDWDHDGLLNYQEYLVQALRHLRYDDCETPLMGSWLKDGTSASRAFRKFLPMQTWDGDDFIAKCKEAGFGGIGYDTGTDFYRNLGYFARPPHAWDRLYCSMSGRAQMCVAYGNAMDKTDPRNGFRVMLRPTALLADGSRSMTVCGGFYAGEVGYYASTDPRRWDSDSDGMGDYYELFHGLNPLLGSSKDPSASNAFGEPNYRKYDRIGFIYSHELSPLDAWHNAWTGWGEDSKDWGSLDVTVSQKMFDPMRYPWMMGCAEADADGDGLRNSEESIQPNVTTPKTYHTDPTPLWYTDSTIANKASFVAQYYCVDPYIMLSDGADKHSDLLNYPWQWSTMTVTTDDTVDGNTRNWMFAFEENEGYDSDHDFVRDGDELVKRVTNTSDPLNSVDPDRRQALYFPGSESAAVSYAGPFARAYSSEYDLLRQFTVECWVKPLSVGDQVFLERVSNYAPASLAAATAVIRANFRLGMDGDGFAYGEFESSVGNGSVARVKTEKAIAIGKWTHLALTFNGSTLALYTGADEAPAVKSPGTALIPANGISRAEQNPLNLAEANNSYGYDTVPTAIILGASAKDGYAIALSEKTTWDSYAKNFHGYIDEVRVWDGARSGSEIKADCNRRYTFEDVVNQRKEVYDAWLNDKRRGNKFGAGELPAELVMHYNFTQLPGAVNEDEVAIVPTGFKSAVFGLISVPDADIGDRSEEDIGSLRCGWWNALSIRSDVYSDAHFVPWIANTVRHLPNLDGSAPDSEYWSAYYAGTFGSYECGYNAFEFPNTANPYPYWMFSMERFNHQNRLAALNGAMPNPNIAKDAYNRFTFDMRAGFVGTGDLLPLGGTFTKRSEDFWDGLGAVDACELTGVDTDADELPDWWERLYPGGVAGISWDSEILYEGKLVKAYEAYLRDLAKGLLPGTSLSYNATYVSTLDANGNSIPDWWEHIYGTESVSALADDDNDQLSNYVEYMINEQFSQYPGFAKLDPEKMKSLGQMTPDYFLKVGQLYLGEMFTDHDFIEDWWEDQYSSDPLVAARFTYDADNDPDDDGWRNYSERRARTEPNRISYLGVDEMTVPEFPVPVIKVSARYNGKQKVNNNNVVVQAWRQDDAMSYPDAVWTINVSGAAQADDNEKNSNNSSGSAQYAKLLGINPSREMSWTCGPGSVVQGTFALNLKDLSFLDVEAYRFNGYETVISSELGGAKNAVWLECAIDRVRSDDNRFGDIVAVASNRAATVLAVIGTINYESGEVTADLSKLPANFEYDRQVLVIEDHDEVRYKLVTSSNSYVKATWSSKQAAQGFPQTFYLSDADNLNDSFSRGHLREGKNLFTAFIDIDGNGKYSPGEPYGAVSDVEVGWSGNEFEIELTDIDPSMVRIDLSSLLTLSTADASSKSTSSASGGSSFEILNGQTDRGVIGGVFSNYEKDDLGGTNLPKVAKTRVRVYRYAVNVNPHSYDSNYGYDPGQSGAVLDIDFDASTHTIITEADLMAAGVPDLDFGTVTSVVRDFSGVTLNNLTNVSYCIWLGDRDPNSGDYGKDGSFAPLVFVNTFERGTSPTPTVPVSPKGDSVSGRPVFKWRAGVGTAKEYPAFQLCVWEKSSNRLMFNSGIVRMPPRNSEGVYSWTAPICAGMVTPEGNVFSTANNYIWAVAMRDAKFDSTDPADMAREIKQEFRLAECDALGTLSDYGALPVAVRYFGPAKVSVSPSDLRGLVRVQAFTSPDFTGMPVGEGYLTDKAALADNNAAFNVNAVVHGLPKGAYFLRAYIDSNANGVKDAWESWGYLNYVGYANTKDVYDPRAFTLPAAGVSMPVIYIEDADTDNDGFPDAWEYDRNGSLDVQNSATGNSLFTHVNTNLAASVAAFTKMKADSDGGANGLYAMKLMSAFTGPELADSLAAASLMSVSADMDSTEKTVVAIDAFSIEEGLSLSVKTEVNGLSGAYVVVDNEAKVGVWLVAANSPDFVGAKSIKVKDITIRANETADIEVSAAEIAEAIKVNGLSSAVFFKVRLEK